MMIFSIPINGIVAKKAFKSSVSKRALRSTTKKSLDGIIRKPSFPKSIDGMLRRKPFKKPATKRPSLYSPSKQSLDGILRKRDTRVINGVLGRDPKKKLPVPRRGEAFDIKQRYASEIELAKLQAERREFHTLVKEPGGATTGTTFVADTKHAKRIGLRMADKWLGSGKKIRKKFGSTTYTFVKQADGTVHGFRNAAKKKRISRIQANFEVYQSLPTTRRPLRYIGASKKPGKMLIDFHHNFEVINSPKRPK
ncbi:hypothetical protein [Actinomyces oris]|uniref:hypothetical protein n=1 Tax=Actinomyces oris TaxID=544580 RepID=UPI0011787B19|nr:hypothetical protein [Actinomyces oris]